MKVFSLFTLSLAPFLLLSCSSTPSSSFRVVKTTSLRLKTPVSVGKTISNQEVFLGGFSGLMLKKSANKDELVFETITDRGPNGYLTNSKERPFLLPDFSPQIVSLKANLKEQNFFFKGSIKPRSTA